MANTNRKGVGKVATGVQKAAVTSLSEVIVPLLHQRLSSGLRALSNNISTAAETHTRDAAQQLATLVEVSLADLQLGDIGQLADLALGRCHHLSSARSIFRRPEVPSWGEPTGSGISRDLYGQAPLGISFDGPLSTPSDRSSRRGSPSPLEHKPSPSSSTSKSQSGLASTDITFRRSANPSPESIQTPQTVQARVFDLQHHHVDGNPKTSLDLVSCPELGSRTLDNEDPLPHNTPSKPANNHTPPKQKRHKFSCPARKLNRSQSASPTAAATDPPILRKPKPRGRLSTEIFTASDGIVPLFNTPLSRQRPSPSLIAIAGMMLAVGELDRLSLMADATPLGLFAARGVPVTPVNTPSGFPLTAAAAVRAPVERPGAGMVEEGGKPNTPDSPATADFASFSAFARTPSPLVNVEPAQGFLPLLPIPGEVSGGRLGDAGVSEGMSSSMPAMVTVGVEGVGGKGGGANTFPGGGELEGMGKETKR